MDTTEGLLADLQWRGLVHQVTDTELGKILDKESLTAYIGFDPSADSLQLGNLAGILNLVRLQGAGHRPIALAGGGTGLVGDPSGKSAERSLLTAEQLEANLAGIRAQLGRFLDFDAGALLLDNGAWLWSLGLLEFLRDVGKHFTVNTMIAKESVRARLEEREQGISYTEFSYMLLQAYDFLQLYERHGCTLQAGGSDQWGNITMGVDLVRRSAGAAVYGLTTPLVTKADGTKYGKSVEGAVWLDPAKTSPYAMWQFLYNAEDAKVGEYLRFFTWRTKEEVAELDRATAEAPRRRQALRVLANDVTALVHGAEAATRAEAAADALFAGDFAALDLDTLDVVLADAPGRRLPPEGLSVTEALVVADLAAS
ncbi:MAG TPA: tyrosine--tRNA ligase, partial [Acidimicrobiales bacterium]|nr:tyrosine--tRNA ligase [Acidimicrobiales bacterium]